MSDHAMKALVVSLILGLAGANWVIEQGYLPLALGAAVVLVVAFLVVFGPRERGQTTTSPAPVGGRPCSGSPSHRLSPSPRSRPPLGARMSPRRGLPPL